MYQDMNTNKSGNNQSMSDDAFDIEVPNIYHGNVHRKIVFNNPGSSI